MKPYTLQEAFDKSYLHLVKQGKPAIDHTIGGELGSGRCRYRAPDGSKCAIGCLIPDELYRPDLEGSNIQYLHHHHCGGDISELLGLRDQSSLSFLSHLQLIHDDLGAASDDFVEKWKEQAGALALSHGLTVPEVTE